MHRYKHIFFDLDHTLWDFDSNAKHSLSDIYAEHHLHSLVTEDFNAFYKSYLHHNKILWDRFQNGYITAEELRWKRMWRTLLDFKIGDEVLAKKLSARFLELLPTKTGLFPHTIEILEYLQGKEYVLHLITNGFEKTQWKKLHHSKLDRFFTHVITSEASNCVKPEKEIFEYALQKANAEKQESIMIGDNLDADIQGAINAGIDNIFVNHINDIPWIQSTYTVTHLSQLEKIL